MANRRNQVTCQAIKANGERCKQTRGLVEGFCASHRPVVVEPTNVLVVCKYVWTSGRKCEEIAVKDGFCHLHRPDNYDTFPVESNANLSVDEGIADILDEIFNHVPEDKVIDLPSDSFEVEELPVRVAREAIQGQVGSLESTGELVIPAEVFAKYSHLMKYVSMDAVANQDLFAAYIIKVKDMNLLQAGLEFKFLKSQEDDFSAESKRLTEEAHQEYGRNIPLDIQMDIDAVLDNVMDYKNKRAVVMAYIEHLEAQEEVEDWNGMDKSWEAGDKKPLEDVVKDFFGGLWNKVKGIVPQTLMAVGVVLVALAVAAMMNMGVDKAPAPKTTPVHHNTVVEHHSKPVVKHKPVVDVGPTDNVAARHNASHAVTYTVKAGDTLWTIAKAEYGDASKWIDVYNANKDMLTRDDVRNVTDAGHWIHVGQSLKVVK